MGCVGANVFVVKQITFDTAAKPCRREVAQLLECWLHGDSPVLEPKD